MKLYTLCVCVLLSLPLQAQDTFKSSPSVRMGLGINVPFNDDGSEKNPWVLKPGLGKLIGVTYTDKRHSNRLIGISWINYHNWLGGRGFWDSYTTSNGPVRSNLIRVDLIFPKNSKGSTNRYLPYAGVGLGNVVLPDFKIGDSYSTGGYGWAIVESAGITFANSTKFSQVMVDLQISYLQQVMIYNIDKTSASIFVVTNFLPQITVIYNLDLQHFVQNIQQ